MGYPFSKAETVADGAVHAAGLAFAIPATALLAMNTDNTWAVLLYGLCMVGAFAASAIYHMSPIDRTRPLLHRLDHAAIYFKIAGTYTPLVAVIGSGFAYGILGIVWALALIGAVAKLWFWKTDARYHPGKLVGTGLLVYGFSRFIVEFFRQPDKGLENLSWGLTMGQTLTVPMLLLGIYLVLTSKGRRVRVEPTAGDNSVA